MKIDKEIAGFRLQQSTRIEDIDSEGLVLTHDRSGARLVASRNYYPNLSAMALPTYSSVTAPRRAW